MFSTDLEQTTSYLQSFPCLFIKVWTWGGKYWLTLYYMRFRLSVYHTSYEFWIIYVMLIPQTELGHLQNQLVFRLGNHTR